MALDTPIVPCGGQNTLYKKFLNEQMSIRLLCLSSFLPTIEMSNHPLGTKSH